MHSINHNEVEEIEYIFVRPSVSDIKRWRRCKAALTVGPVGPVGCSQWYPNPIFPFIFLPCPRTQLICVPWTEWEILLVVAGPHIGWLQHMHTHTKWMEKEEKHNFAQLNARKCIYKFMSVINIFCWFLFIWVYMFLSRFSHNESNSISLSLLQFYSLWFRFCCFSFGFSEFPW